MRLHGKFVWPLLLQIGMVHAITNGLISDAVIKPPEYSSLVPAGAVGSSYVDPAFGTRITRVTNCGLAGNDVLGGYMGNSEICMFNADGSYFIATENILENGKQINATFLYSGSTGSRLKMLGKDTMRPWWIRWTGTGRYKKNSQTVTFDPVHHFYKYEGNEIRLYDVRAMDNYVLLHRFSEYTAIGPAGGEGDVSDDGRYWCLDGDQRELFVYDLVDDIKYPASTFDAGVIGSPGSELGVDYAAVSPSGQYVVVSWSTTPMEARFHGIEVYDRNFQFQRQIYPGIIHWELGVDSQGYEVIYTTAGFALAEYFTSRGVQPGDVISIRLNDGYIRLLRHMESWAPQIMSGCNSVHNRDYIYVAFYGRSSDPNNLWAPFWGEIVEIPTNGSQQVRRLVHHRSRPQTGKSEKYWQPDFVVNRQGTRIVYRSTYVGPTADLYLFDVGSRTATPTDTTPPAPPFGLSSPAQTFNSILLTWERSPQAADGDYASYYRILRDDVLLAEIVETQYTDLEVQEAAGYRYKVYAVDKVGLASNGCAEAVFRTAADMTPPTVLYASIQDRSHLVLKFSEAVEKSSAETLTNYQMQPALAVRSAKLSGDGVIVTLQCEEMQLGAAYQLAVQNIRDRSRAGNLLTGSGTFELRLLADFYDDFNQGLSPVWQLRNPERWRVQEDEGDASLFLAGENYDSPDGKRLGEYALLDINKFWAREFLFRCSMKSPENIIDNRYADYAFVFAYQDSMNYFYVQWHSYDVSLTKIANGEKEILSKSSLTLALDRYQSMTVRVQWDTCTVQVGDQIVLSRAVSGMQPGQVGLGSFNDACFFDDVELESFYKKDTIPPNPPQGVIASPMP